MEGDAREVGAEAVTKQACMARVWEAAQLALLTGQLLVLTSQMMVGDSNLSACNIGALALGVSCNKHDMGFSGTERELLHYYLLVGVQPQGGFATPISPSHVLWYP